MAAMHDSDVSSYRGSLPEKFQVISSDVALTSNWENAVPVRRRVWLKMDLFLLPVATMFLFLQFLDKSNIGNARVAGLQKELAMTDTQYSIALSITYIPYVLVELPTTLLLKHVGPNILLPAMVTLWGIVATLQGLVTSYSGLIACRFFIGLFEGGLLPGLALYFASFYPRQKLQLRISIFFVSTSLAGAFSGLLAAAIIKMEGVGGKHGWAWIFILEGLVTVVFGVASFWLMPRSPFTAKFLSTEDKAYVEHVLHDDGIIPDHPREDKFNWSQVLDTLTKPHVLLMIVAGFFNGTTLSGLAYFTPSIVAGLGYTADRAQLMSVPPFAASFVLSIASSFVSDSYGCRGLTLIFFSLVSITGFAMFLGSEANPVRYGALFLLLPGTYCAAPPLAAWVANNAAPHVRRATALAALTTVTNAGAILSTWLLGALSPAPRYTKATITLLVFQVGILVCAAANVAYLVARNSQKRVTREYRRRADEGRGVGDDSAWFEYKL